MNGKLRCWLLSEEGKAGVGRAVWAEGASRKVERGGGREREREREEEREKSTFFLGNRYTWE